MHAIEELSIIENNAYWDFRALMRDESYLLDLHTALTLARLNKSLFLVDAYCYLLKIINYLIQNKFINFVCCNSAAI